MKFDACEQCGGPVRSKRVTVDLRRKERLCVFHNVPVGVCTRCGERYHPGRVLEQLDEVVAHGLERSTKIKVPTFDYSEIA